MAAAVPIEAGDLVAIIGRRRGIVARVACGLPACRWRLDAVGFSRSTLIAAHIVRRQHLSLARSLPIVQLSALVLGFFGIGRWFRRPLLLHLLLLLGNGGRYGCRLIGFPLEVRGLRI
jgi:hypothetical protein